MTNQTKKQPEHQQPKSKRFALDQNNPCFDRSMLDHARQKEIGFLPPSPGYGTRSSSPEYSLNERILNERTRKGRTIRDRDNAHPKPPPPFQLDNPRLAPPGMAGIRPNAGNISDDRKEQESARSASPTKPRNDNRQQLTERSTGQRDFKPIYTRTKNDGHTREH